MRRTMALFAFVLLAVPAAARAQSDEEAVRAAVDRLFDGMRAGDSTAVRSAFHSSARLATVVDEGGNVELRIAESLDGFVRAVGTPHEEVWDERLHGVEVRVDGRLASVWTQYDFYLGDRLSHCGVDVFHLFQDGDGAWKIFDLADTRRREGCGAAPSEGSR